jgi:predicted tellurium resistance membrane protein TerC
MQEEQQMQSVFRSFAQLVWIFQSAYYLVTGIMPFVALRLFLKITGPKTDIWLVKTVAALVTAIAAVIASAGMKRRITPEIEGMAIGSSLGLAGIDLWYTAQGRISKVYLLDALAEGLLVLGWLARRRSSTRREGAGKTASTRS